MKTQLILFQAILSMLFTSCNNNRTLFEKIDTRDSGLNFSNQLTETDSLNILVNEFVYNGAGVALGDLNGDGLDDIFLAGNQVDNKLFINKGKLKFQDASEIANTKKPNSYYWSSGVSIVDLNLDGKLDIYICNTLRKNDNERKNLLYINQGNNDKNVPIFKELSHAYHLDDDSHSSNAQFFDYDNDGDLDLFIAVNRIEGINPNQFRPLTNDTDSMSRDKLFKNTFSKELGHPVFEEVTLAAGIRYNGFSHSTLINDFNNDGWLDIYVANDYLTSDLIYINNQDGTFTNKAGTIFKHFSLSSMGSDISDINNDGRLDLFTTEMQPYYNKRKKLFQGGSSYQREMLIQRYDYEYQYTRNTMQLNFGENPDTGLPIYGEIGMYAGLHETDWSWASLFADYDNDGWQDLLVVNGFPKDVTDRDFGDFRVTASRLISQEKLIAAIPEVKSPNFIFRNNGDLTFEDKTKDWGLDFITFSNGAAYGDLDNDGDLDLVINNINDPVILMENHSNTLFPDSNFLRIKLKGSANNPAAIGASVEIFVEGQAQKKTIMSNRGYLSKTEDIVHFGLGKNNQIDSLIITWPGGIHQSIAGTKANQVVTFQLDSNLVHNTRKKLVPNTLFSEVSDQHNLFYMDCEIDFIDFNFQRTLPHKFSQFGPSLAVGDVNNDGLDDLFIGASRSFKERWFIQRDNGHFEQNEVVYKEKKDRFEEDSGTLLFDADNDGDLDLYIARGSAQYPSGDKLNQDVLMINDGKGNFHQSTDALPAITANGSSVRAADYDRDGDLDLFIGSRVLPHAYPKADRSYVLRNDQNIHGVKFVDITSEVSSKLLTPGLISDALWTDFNGDFWPDLILIGEWMSVRFFENKKGKFIEVTEKSGIQNYKGWWNSIAAADMDNDGDIDYIVGSYGENMYLRGNKEQPIRVYSKDLDNNGSIDPLISYYLRDSIGTKQEYLYHPWEDVTKQFVGIRKNFNSFGEFGETTAPEMFSNGLMENAEIFEANWMKTSYVENLGQGKFKITPLPKESQLAPIYGILPYDYDNDNLLDIILVGNDFGMEVQQGRADAFNGLVLHNIGQGNFDPLSLNESGFFVPGDAKSLVSINLDNQKSLIIASQNDDRLKVYENTKYHTQQQIKVMQHEVKCKVFLKDGKIRIEEFYWGNTFQSQSSRTLKLNGNETKVIFYNNEGMVTRNIIQ